MNIEVQDVSATRKKLVVSLDAAEIAAERKAVVAEISRSVRLPGFRPGKAPAAMIEKRYAKHIDDELKQKILSKSYREGLEKQKLQVIQLINIEGGDTIAADAPATLTLTVDVEPTFELPDYTGLPTTIQPTDATDAEVEELLQNLRAERADFKVAERPAQKSDYVKLSYEGTVDGKPALELVGDKQIYASVPQTWEEVEGAHDGLIPGLGKHLAGLAKDDKKDIPITFPADFAAVPALAGKTVTYAVTVQEIRERVLPEINEEFLKAHQVETLDALKDNLRKQLTARKENANRNDQRRQVAEALCSKVEFEIPLSLIEAETQNTLRNFMEDNLRRGATPEQFEENKKELYEGARKVAVTRVKTQIILSKIAAKEELKVTERDIDSYLYQQAMRTGQRPEKIVKELTQNRDRLQSIQQGILFDKSLELVVSKATVTTNPAKA
ncbi:trigger factor [Opitutaceae bacterium TAV4]|nr:trigger factor [Opitutaceae bacterium TAV4]RRK01600.1 trigger factor [Opitutaceae bacterium TAV3]